MAISIRYFLCISLLFAASAQASITMSGNVEPAVWSFSEDGYIGKTSDGSLTVVSTGPVENLISQNGYLGYAPNVTGTATISGSNANWNNDENLYVGYEGIGQLNIDGGQVSGREVWIGATPSGTGAVHFNTGTLRADTLFADPADLTGTGIIQVEGLVSDIDLWFDATHGGHQIITLNGSNQNIEVQLNMNQYSDIGVGYRGNTTLNIQGGVTVTNDESYLGVMPGSVGTATVSDANSKWESEYIYVGYHGVGQLNIVNGGEVVALETRVGCFAEGEGGTIHLDTGGSLTTGRLYADPADLTGTGNIYANEFVGDMDLVFDATHSTSQPIAANQNVEIHLMQSSQGIIEGIGVGYKGTGSLTIRDGATVEAQLSRIGILPGSIGTVNVSGENTTWDNSVILGLGGIGRLNVTEGGTATSFSGIIALQPGSEGYATISGSGSTWNSSVLVGNMGAAQLSITDGGMVVGERGDIGSLSGSEGTVIVSGDGSSWITTSNLLVGYEGAGVLNITDGGLVKVGEYLAIDYYENDNSFINMSSGGMVAILGDVDGSLVDFLDSEWLVGTDAIRWWNRSLGDWDLLTTATLGTDYTLEYMADGDLSGYTLLTVTASELVPGDANKDGKVDGSDVTILANNWQRGVTGSADAIWEMGDFNRDGRVDGSDVTILANNWQYGVTAVAAAVPEPAVFWLSVSGLLAVWGFFQRKKK